MPYLPAHVKRQDTTVRVTGECRRMLSELKIGDEPLGNVVLRALVELQQTKSELGKTRKKAEALEQELWNKSVAAPLTLEQIRERYKQT